MTCTKSDTPGGSTGSGAEFDMYGCLVHCMTYIGCIFPVNSSIGFLELDADLCEAQLMPLPLTVSCFSKIQIGFTFLVSAHMGSPGQRAVKRVCVFFHRVFGSPATKCFIHHYNWNCLFLIFWPHKGEQELNVVGIFWRYVPGNVFGDISPQGSYHFSYIHHVPKTSTFYFLIAVRN